MQTQTHEIAPCDICGDRGGRIDSRSGNSVRLMLWRSDGQANVCRACYQLAYQRPGSPIAVIAKRRAELDVVRKLSPEAKRALHCERKAQRAKLDRVRRAACKSDARAAAAIARAEAVRKLRAEAKAEADRKATELADAALNALAARRREAEAAELAQALLNAKVIREAYGHIPVTEDQSRWHVRPNVIPKISAEASKIGPCCEAILGYRAAWRRITGAKPAKPAPKNGKSAARTRVWRARRAAVAVVEVTV